MTQQMNFAIPHFVCNTNKWPEDMKEKCIQDFLENMTETSISEFQGKFYIKLMSLCSDKIIRKCKMEYYHIFKDYSMTINVTFLKIIGSYLVGLNFGPPNTRKIGIMKELNRDNYWSLSDEILKTPESCWCSSCLAFDKYYLRGTADVFTDDETNSFMCKNCVQRRFNKREY